MKTTTTFLAGLVLTCGALVTSTHAQRGVGESTGVARQAIKPEIVTLSGKLVEIRTGPCEKTTGRSPIGTHIFLETDKGDNLNVHLGPQWAVADTAATLKVGTRLTVKAFRTAKMPEKNYVAQSLAFGETTVDLRDEGLRPVWGGQGARRGRWDGGPAWARGKWR